MLSALFILCFPEPEEARRLQLSDFIGRNNNQRLLSYHCCQCPQLLDVHPQTLRVTGKVPRRAFKVVHPPGSQLPSDLDPCLMRTCFDLHAALSPEAWELGTWTPSSWEAEESWWVRLGHWRQCTEKGLVPCHSNAGLGTECATMRVSCCKTNLVLSVFFLPCDRCLPPLHALLAALARAPAVWCHVTVSKTVN